MFSILFIVMVQIPFLLISLSLSEMLSCCIWYATEEYRRNKIHKRMIKRSMKYLKHLLLQQIRVRGEGRETKLNLFIYFY